MSKILALDFGLKRTGIAITDDSNTIAFGLDTVASELLMTKLTEIVPKENVKIIVLGLPKRLNNEDSHITENVKMLAEVIRQNFLSLEVVLLDERFTSKMALQSMHFAGATKKQKKQKEIVDKVSATIILQSYLSSIEMR